MIRILAKVVIHDEDHFKCLCAILLSEDQYKQLANNLLTVYCMLKFEVDISKQLNYEELFVLLKDKNFFTKHEEKILSGHGQEKGKLFMIVLKDNYLQFITEFLSYLKGLPKYNSLVSKIENEITSIKSDIHTYISSVNLTANILLEDFQQYLIQRYTSKNFVKTHNSINAPTICHINLALIDNNDNEHFCFSDYSLLYEQQSQKTYLDSYSDIFIDGQRLVVLQGPPGSGKTTLAKHLCQQWANGKILQSFSHVIFVQLRDVRVANFNSFEELIKFYMSSCLGESITKEIFKIHGKNFLIILEGWDELPQQIRCNNFTLFQDLMLGTVLPSAVIVVTTRSSVVMNLPVDIICRRIEVLGFTKQQVKKYVEYFLDHDSLSVAKFWNELNDLPDIKSLLFIPVNLCILLNMFQENDQTMPHTYTELYTTFLLSQLSIYHSKTSYSCAKFKSFDSLPPDISNMVYKFGKLGYHYLLEGMLSFSEEEINSHCFDSKGIPLELDEVAIFEQHMIVYCEHVSKIYQFMHRTFQELLAAWYLSNQTIPIQLSAVSRHFKEKKLEEFWIFYAGLTKFTSISFDRVLSSNYIQQIKCHIKTFIVSKIGITAMRPANVKDIISTFVSTELHAVSISKYISQDFQITLLAAVKESQNPQVCKALCSSYIFYQDTCWFTVPKNALTPQILLALSYLIAHSGKKWIIQFKKLENDDADCLLKYLTCNKSVDCPCNNCKNLADRTDNTLFALDLNSSQESVVGLVKLVKAQKYLQWIILSRSECVDDTLVIELAEALKENCSLKMLHLFECNITSVGAKAIVEMLKENSTLEWIGLKENKKTLKEEDIVLLLETINNYNTTVYMLMLDDIFCRAPKVQELLTTINASRNNDTEKLCIRFVDSLRWSNILKLFVPT